MAKTLVSFELAELYTPTQLTYLTFSCLVQRRQSYSGVAMYKSPDMVVLREYLGDQYLPCRLVNP